jgi:hypothetical protein
MTNVILGVFWTDLVPKLSGGKLVTRSDGARKAFQASSHTYHVSVIWYTCKSISQSSLNGHIDCTNMFHLQKLPDVKPQIRSWGNPRGALKSPAAKPSSLVYEVWGKCFCHPTRFASISLMARPFIHSCMEILTELYYQQHGRF